MAAAAAAGCRTSCRRQTTQTSGGWTSPDHRAEVCMRALHHSPSGLKAGKPQVTSGAFAQACWMQQPCLSPEAFACSIGKAAACASQAERAMV